MALSIHFVGKKLYLISGTQLKPGQELSPLFGIVNELIPFLVIFFVTWIMSKIERRPNSVYGFHTSWDWGQSFLYGVPDSGLMVQHHLFATHPVGRRVLSGGTTGPEGSIFVVLILVLVSVAILFTLPSALIAS